MYNFFKGENHISWKVTELKLIIFRLINLNRDKEQSLNKIVQEEEENKIVELTLEVKRSQMKLLRRELLLGKEIATKDNLKLVENKIIQDFCAERTENFNTFVFLELPDQELRLEDQGLQDYPRMEPWLIGR